MPAGLLLKTYLLRFLYDGSRIGDEDTPESLDMEDNGACRVCPPCVF